MTKDELIRILLTESCDPEKDHGDCDDALLAYIDDEDVTRAFNSVGKWYA